MGEEVRGIPEAAPLGGSGGPGGDVETASIGAYLALQRRLRGIGLDDLEAATRIPRRSLERLEAGYFDRDRDGFARGFVRTVAVALGLDPDETVNRMRSEPPLDPRQSPPSAWRRAWPWLAGLTALALVASLALWLAGARRGGERAAPRPSQVIQRPDPVRALAEAERLRERAVAGAESSRPPAPAQRPEARRAAASPAPSLPPAPRAEGAPAADAPSAGAGALAGARPAAPPARRAPDPD